MASFFVYKRMTKMEYKKAAKEALDGIKKWFDDNPKRRVCHAGLWQGIQCTVTRKNLVEVITGHLDKALQENVI